ncbi:hypothetical protein [Geobacter sp.]|uniref:hypothetical protein n=1 Tax=Geobacter sp. TaxID=46610 RepID=UPI0026391807|nr:hypothetical protein [Geobacter sp.]
MKTRHALGLSFIALIVGACLGIVLRMHMAQDMALVAMADRSLAERDYYHTSARALEAEVARIKIYSRQRKEK